MRVNACMVSTPVDCKSEKSCLCSMKAVLPLDVKLSHTRRIDPSRFKSSLFFQEKCDENIRLSKYVCFNSEKRVIYKLLYIINKNITADVL